ncbi:extracellular solute-binding protein [Gallaecimonas kandeliae]|uniref:extracellular solute-binding protein n=1 Tax=Gallaecimonas kandeliae TaxID=3029055 RepID=UPI002647453B|nr:extracellular solute-binding protein [Gallaecimonas kandeliae]WKE67313.1 extracellular solute-binding protein [Gallaecimonas kandeliae]
MNKQARQALLALAMGAAAFGAQAADKTLNLYVWSEYIPEEVIDNFTKDTGIEVNLTTYESNEAMFAKLKLTEGAGYDVVVPSTYYISLMQKDGLIQKLDKSKLANFKNLDPALLNKAYDPGNQYSVPYFWGSTAIGVNTDDIDPKAITSWKDLFKPEYKGKLLLTDDVREVFQIGLKLNGYSANSTDPEQIKKAYETLKPLVANTQVFNSDAPRMPYLSGDVDIGMIWNGEVYMANKEGGKLAYVYPKEGAIFWVDSFAVPSHAEHPDAALQFINYMMRPQVAKACVEYVGYATPNVPGRALLPDELKNSPVIFPSKDIVAKGEFQTDVGDAISLYESYWTKLKTGK